MIKLKTNKLEAFTCEQCPENLLTQNWTVVLKRRTPYLVRSFWDKKLKIRSTEYLHRLLIGASPGEYVDHINGNTLDNRLENLRICCNKENIRNQKIRVDNTSGYKGVCKTNSKLKKPYLAYINVNKVRIYLGYFSDKISAAKAYDRAAKKYHKQFAKLNFPKK